ncbi:hypothetical protein Daus18300_008520 [Diaporthe australafricana]|uniref:Nephrocystin 3-like N-terminal domain-containing protein n=1 Tax=Diaporthe australafricana TaxID=127596 RepID=A0ABR3WIA0_9PEZI
MGRHFRSESPKPPTNTQDTTAKQAVISGDARLSTPSVVVTNPPPSAGATDASAGSLTPARGRSTRSSAEGGQGKTNVPVPLRGAQEAETGGGTEVAVDVRQQPGSNVSNAAYHRAWAALGEDEKRYLTDEVAIRALFLQLDETDQKHQSESYFKRGRMAAGLRYIEQTCGYLSLVASFVPEPSGSLGSAIGLLKGTVTILTDCYSILLQFYSKVAAFFRQQSRIKRVLETFKSEIPGIVASFNSKADDLARYAQMEILVTVAAIHDQQLESFVQENLCIQDEIQTERLNKEQRRSDDACAWITAERQFVEWTCTIPGVLTLFGDMGCGKTAVASYVVQYLTQSLPATTPVLAFYCIEQSKVDLRTIYKAFVYQLLQKRTELKVDFQRWYDRSKSDTQGFKPTDHAGYLAEFLSEAIRKSKSSIAIVLDGLDECDEDTRHDVIALFRDLIREGARLRVFLSSRPLDDVQTTLTQSSPDAKEEAARIPEPALFHADMKPTRDRDRILAQHLSQRLDLKVQPTVVAQLSELAEGSAMWLCLAAEALRKAGVRNEAGLRRILEFLRTSPSLVGLYRRLFDSDDIEACADVVERALETLAVARRPLTPEELSYAAFMDDCGASLSELDEGAASVDLLALIRPFVSITSLGTQRGIGVHLVHQSLLDLILRAPPTSWSDMVEAKDGRQQNSQGSKQAEERRKRMEERRGQLNGTLLRSCVTYLLYDEFKDKDLASTFSGGLMGIADTYDDEFPLGGFGDMEGEDDDACDDAPQEQEKGRMEFNPAELGFGKFFAYAGAYWSHHLVGTPLGQRPEARVFADLCARDTPTLKNWVEMWKRPECTFSEEWGFFSTGPLDPLTVMASLDPNPSLLTELAVLAKEEPEMFSDEPQLNMMRSLVGLARTDAITKLLEDPTIGEELCSCGFFDIVLRNWKPPSEQARDPKAWDVWEKVFDVVIRTLGHRLIEKAHYILRMSCQKGCLVLVKQLFRAAAQDPELRREMLSVQENWARSSSLYHHQSVGEAAAFNFPDIVAFLCQQEGIEAHLRHVNHNGHTVFHQAMKYPNAELHEILIPAWPAGLNLPDTSGDQPVDHLIFSSTIGNGVHHKALRTYLRLGLGRIGSAHLAGETMRCATAKPDVAMCRILVVEGGVDPWTVVGLDGETGRPALRKDRQPSSELAAEAAAELLGTMCALMPMPLAVQT